MPETPEWGTYCPSRAGRLVIALCRHSLVGRGPARKAAANVFRQLHQGPVDCRLWGSRVRLYPANNRSDRKALLRPDRFDARELEVLRAQMGQRGAVFVDVGANSGFYSLYAALHAGPAARIVAIEPAAEVLARLSFNVSLARDAQRIDPEAVVHTIAAAVGDRDGEAVLSTQGAEGCRSLLGSTGRPVPLRLMSALLDERGIVRIDAMKIDVEGYEDRVLLPYLASVERARWPRLIILEHIGAHKWQADCLSFCQQRGFRRAFVTRNNTILKLDQ